MNSVRKEWLLAADGLLKLIGSKEKELDVLKKNKQNGYVVQKINNEIDILIKFYNDSETVFQAYEWESINMKMNLALLQKEKDEYYSIIMDMGPEPGKEMEFLDRFMNAGTFKISKDDKEKENTKKSENN